MEYCLICSDPLIKFGKKYICKKCNITYKKIKGKLIDEEGELL